MARVVTIGIDAQVGDEIEVSGIPAVNMFNVALLAQEEYERLSASPTGNFIVSGNYSVASSPIRIPVPETGTWYIAVSPQDFWHLGVRLVRPTR